MLKTHAFLARDDRLRQRSATLDNGLSCMKKFESPAGNNLSDAALLQAIVGREVWALAALYDRYATVLYSLAWNILGREKPAQDAVTRTFLTIWQNGFADSGAIRPHLGSWLVLTCRKFSLAQLHEPGSFSFTQAEEIVQYADGAHDAVLGSEAGNRIRGILAQLPPRQKQIVEMSFLKGMKPAEIAIAAGLQTEEVQVHMHQTMRKIAEPLREDRLRD